MAAPAMLLATCNSHLRVGRFALTKPQDRVLGLIQGLLRPINGSRYLSGGVVLS
jgi:hypothetical protein